MQPRTSDPSLRRTELLMAARYELANSAYEQVGLRQIAARAGMDTAKLMREFGSKELLLAEVLNDALPTNPPPLPATWPEDFAAELTGRAAVDLTEAFRILAFSAPSPAVEAAVRARVPVLLGPLEDAIGPGGAHSVRAAMAAAVIFGVIITRDVIGLEPPGGRQICAPFIARLLSALQRRPSPPASVSPLRAEAGEPRPFGVAESKAAILKAADSAFSHLGYEHASVRRIAAEAQVDPALVIRYYGSKEALFREVLQLHFSPPPEPDADFATAASALADPEDGGSSLDITLRSAISPTGRKIIKADIESRFINTFIRPSADGKAEGRALMRSALFIGASFCNSILRAPAIHAHRAEAREQLTALFRLARTGAPGPSPA